MRMVIEALDNDSLCSANDCFGSPMCLRFLQFLGYCTKAGWAIGLWPFVPSTKQVLIEGESQFIRFSKHESEEVAEEASHLLELVGQFKEQEASRRAMTMMWKLLSWKYGMIPAACLATASLGYLVSRILQFDLLESLWL